MMHGPTQSDHASAGNLASRGQDSGSQLGMLPVKALIVEDNPEDRLLLEIHLKKAVPDLQSVDVASNLKAGFDFIRDNAISIVFLDLDLPETSGPETVSNFLSKASDIPVVVISGQDSPTVALEVIQRGAQEYMSKDELTALGISRAMKNAIQRHTLQNQVKLLLAEHSTPTLIVDPAGQVRFVNRSACDMLCRDSDELLHSFFDVELADGVHSEMQVFNADGSTSYLTLDVASTIWASQPAFVITLYDATEKKRLISEKELALTVADAKVRILRNMSHELRTPLNAVIGFSELILHETFGAIKPEKYKDYVQEVHNSGVLLLNMISDLLDLANIEDDAVQLNKEHTDFTYIVEKIVDEMAPLAEMRSITMETDFVNDPLFLDLDIKRGEQIVKALLQNAIKFSDPGSTVWARTEKHADKITLAIEDTGCGMDVGEIERMLEPFSKQGDETPLVYQSKGVGLGLTLVHRLVVLHSGEFSIDSEIGKGTTVTVTFPLSLPH